MILVIGGSRKEKQLAYNAASFAWKKLFPRINNCYIEIHLKKMEGYQGTCDQVDAREYEIEIDKKQEYDDFVTCIFHEMVHVKQYIRKELYPELVFWKDREEYLNLPWEIEAYEKQEVIWKEWEAQLKPTKVGKIMNYLMPNNTEGRC